MSTERDTALHESHDTETPTKLTPVVIAKCLLGNRDAILQVANCRNAVWLGLLFVLSAGFAREYDGESLLHEPWHLLIPLGASLVTASFLCLLVSLVAYRRGIDIFQQPGVYRSFLGLFWMTAPLAWLYAVPVERFLSAESATAANLTFLGIVATWRVLLVIRIISVAFGARRLIDIVAVVFLFADCVMLIAVFAMPTPVWSLMGGVRLTESEQLMLTVTLNTKIWGVLSLPIWVIGFVVACRRQPPWKLSISTGEDCREVGRSSWLFAGLSIAIWTAVLPFTQPEQFLRQRVENVLQSDQIVVGLQMMSQHDRSDFPPHWDPPPRTGYGEREPHTYAVLQTAAGLDECAGWVRELYTEKLLNSMHRYRTRFYLSDGTSAELPEMLDLLERVPESTRPFAKYYQENPWLFDADSHLSESVKKRARALAGLPSEDDKEAKAISPELE